SFGRPANDTSPSSEYRRLGRSLATGWRRLPEWFQRRALFLATHFLFLRSERLWAPHFRERFLHLQYVPGQYARVRRNRLSKSPALFACRLYGSNETRPLCCGAGEFAPAVHPERWSSACSRCGIRCTEASVSRSWTSI